MAESLAAQRANQRSNQASIGRRLLQLMTFGETSLAFLNVPVAKASQAIELAKRSGDRKYNIKTNGRGIVEIEYEQDDAFTVALFNNSRWVTNLYIEANSLNIGHTGQAKNLQVVTLHVTKNEARNVFTTFKVESRSDALLKRIDVKGHNTSWFSVFSHNANVLMVRPNGDWVAEKIQYYTDQLTTQAINNYRRSNGQVILSSNDTTVSQRRRTIARAITQEKPLTVDFATQTECTLLGSIDLRALQLLKNEQAYQQQKGILKGQFEELRSEQARYEQEAADLVRMEAQLAAVKAQHDHYQEEQSKVANEIVEVNRAKSELDERKRELQEEKENFEREMKDFEALKSQMPPLVPQIEPFLWSRRPGTGQALSHRFTFSTQSMIRLIVTDGKISAIPKPPRNI